MREAVFSSLGETIVGTAVWDLFAGTGAYGLEAVSRGARSVVFVEKDRQALACLAENLDAVLKSIGAGGSAGGDGPSARVLSRDVRRFDAEEIADGVAPDFVFLDPPYAQTEALLAVLAAGLLRQELLKTATVILEAAADADIRIDGWSVSKRIGKSRRDSPGLLFFRKD